VKTRPVVLATALAALLLVVAAVASGCGSSSSTDGVAALDDASTTIGDDATPAAADTEDPQEAALEWAKCMRENGIDVPDPEVDENGRVRLGIGPEGVADEAFEKARDECGTPFGGQGPPQLTDEQRQEMQETLLEFAACMRENGVDMPDPDFSGSGGMMRFRAGVAGIDPQSETFRKAQQACQDILEDAFAGGPGLRVGGGPGGQGSTTDGGS
jgi:hypothetical protein